MELKQATRIICDMMQADPKFRQAWEQAIADAYNEELADFRAKQRKNYVRNKDFSIIAQRAAGRFINDLIMGILHI